MEVSLLKKNAGRNLLGSVAAGPRSGINQYGRPAGFSGRRFKEESIIRGVFFWFKLYSQPSVKPKKISTIIQDLLHRNLGQDGITGLVMTFLGL